MWLSGHRHTLLWSEPDLGLTLTRGRLLRLAITYPFISGSWYRYTSKVWAATCKLSEVSFACGCELVAVGRGQESHLVATITASHRQGHGPPKQCQKMRRSRLFCSVWHVCCVVGLFFGLGFCFVSWWWFCLVWSNVMQKKFFAILF